MGTTMNGKLETAPTKQFPRCNEGGIAQGRGGHTLAEDACTHQVGPPCTWAAPLSPPNTPFGGLSGAAHVQECAWVLSTDRTPAQGARQPGSGPVLHRLRAEGAKRSAPAACASLPLCSCLPVVCADCYECHHLVCHVDIIIFS